MIQVLGKAFDMIDFIAQDPRRRKKLKEIAGHFKMNAGTCANILQTMVRHKYLDQADTRGGYLLGPMMYYLSRQSAYRGDLIAAAEEPMGTLAKNVNETVLLATLRGRERFIILQVEGNQSVQVGRDMFMKDTIYQTATGRLLLAHLGEKELKAFMAGNGPPGPSWPEASSVQKLKAALAEIRSRGWVMNRTASGVIGLAYPVADGARVAAALGLFLPAFRFKGHHKSAIMAGMAEAAAAISGRMARAIPKT
ncbi:MAG: IclR family transcriptional regulator [Kiritimatiellia bacterium]